MKRTYRTLLPETTLWDDLDYKGTLMTDDSWSPFSYHCYRIVRILPSGFTFEKAERNRSTYHYPVAVTGRIWTEQGETRVELDTKQSGETTFSFVLSIGFLIFIPCYVLTLYGPLLAVIAGVVFGAMFLLINQKLFWHTRDELEIDWQLELIKPEEVQLKY